KNIGIFEKRKKYEGECRDEYSSGQHLRLVIAPGESWKKNPDHESCEREYAKYRADRRCRKTDRMAVNRKVKLEEVPRRRNDAARDKRIAKRTHPPQIERAAPFGRGALLACTR